MADDRIYLKCSTCGEYRCIVSMYGGLVDSPQSSLSEWVQKHVYHNPTSKKYGAGLLRFGKASDWFTLESEMGDDYDD